MKNVFELFEENSELYYRRMRLGYRILKLVWPFSSAPALYFFSRSHYRTLVAKYSREQGYDYDPILDFDENAYRQWLTNVTGENHY